MYNIKLTTPFSHDACGWLKIKIGKSWNAEHSPSFKKSAKQFTKAESYSELWKCMLCCYEI